MIFQIDELEDGGICMMLDDAGIDYLELGLQGLRAADVGATLSSETLVSNDGEPIGVGAFTLERA